MQWSTDPTMVKTEEYVFNTTYSLFCQLHKSRSNHSIFGSPEKGKIRAPLTDNGRNPCNWERTMRTLGSTIKQAIGAYIHSDSCWLRASQYIKIATKVSGTLVRMSVVRLLAFIAYPSDDNWERLVGQIEGRGRSGESPFLHLCHNGIGSRASMGCVNGVKHGVFGTVQENCAVKGV